MKKRLLAIVLTVASLLTLLSGLSITASAATVTPPDGLSIENSWDGFKLSPERIDTYEGNGAAHFEWSGSADPAARIVVGTSGIASPNYYKLSFYYKGYANVFKVLNDYGVIFQGYLSADDWTLYEKTFQAGNGKICLHVNDNTDLYMDNFSIKQIDNETDCNEISDELVTHSGFESGDFSAPAVVKNIETVPGNNSVVLSWENPSNDDLSHIVVYRVNDDGTETKVGEATPAVINGVTEKRTSYRVGSLNNGQFYNFRIYAVDTSTNISAPAETFGLPEIEKYTANNLQFRKNSESQTYKASGEIKCTTNIRNNIVDYEDFTPYLITVVYRNNKLISVDTATAVIPVGEMATLTTTVTVPSATSEELNEEFEIISYLWDGHGKTLVNSVALKDIPENSN